MNIGAGIGVGFSNPREEPSFEYQESQACKNGSDVTPVINNPGGTFSSSPSGLSLDANTGVIDVSASTVGNYTVTYSIGPTEDTITILPADDSSFSYSASSFRQNASNPAPTITGLVGGVFSAPSGIVFTDSSSGIINLSASTVGGPYTITYTTTGNCPTSSTFDVTVQVALSITYSAAAFCEDGGNTAAPTVVGDPGSGTFASTTGLTINSTTGVINTDTSTPDENTPYTVTYTASTGETVTTQVTIKNLDNATFSYSATSFCENASNQTPTITTPGGTFTTQDITFRPFQMQFDTSGGKTITIPGTVGSSFTVDWGDGNTTTETGGTISHTYASGIATSTVSIGAIGDSGAFGGLSFNAGGSATDLLEIQQWGSIDFIYLYKGFSGCSSMQITATDSPTLLLSGIGSSTSLQEVFFNCTALTGNSYMSNWDVSNVVTFLNSFKNCTNFNVDISSWDMSNVSNASAMLHTATSFDQPIGSWDLTSATTIAHMLRGTAINQNLGGWSLRTASTPNMTYFLFSTASMSDDNVTDSVVGWANYVYNNTAPFNVSCVGNSINARFDGTRGGGANFATAADAKTYLTTTAGWTIN